MKGFKNAPHITTFAIGMRIHLTQARTGTIIRVLSDRAGLMLFHPVQTAALSQKDMKNYEVDLTSLWVGREFVEKATGLLVDVTAPPDFTQDHYVHYEREDGVLFVRAVECFWDEFEPV